MSVSFYVYGRTQQGNKQLQKDGPRLDELVLDISSQDSFGEMFGVSSYSSLLEFLMGSRVPSWMTAINCHGAPSHSPTNTKRVLAVRTQALSSVARNGRHSFRFGFRDIYEHST